MIIGHKRIISYLTQIRQSKRLSHAYLFLGPSSVGKTTTAFWLASLLFCSKAGKRPCNTCQMCKLFVRKNFPDFYHIKSKKEVCTISIKQIRTLRQAISKTPFYNSYKIAIIESVEQLTTEAANAFLKFLEEPPKKTIFILTANTLQNIPETIVSRAEIIYFQLVNEKEIEAALDNSYTETQKKFIARASAGKPGRALILNPEKIKIIIEKEKKIIKAFKLPKYKRLAILKELVPNNKKSLPAMVSSLLRDALLIQVGHSKNITHNYFSSELTKFANQKTMEQIIDLLNKTVTVPYLIKNNANPLLVWHNIFLKM